MKQWKHPKIVSLNRNMINSGEATGNFEYQRVCVSMMVMKERKQVPFDCTIFGSNGSYNSGTQTNSLDVTGAVCS